MTRESAHVHVVNRLTVRDLRWMMRRAGLRIPYWRVFKRELPRCGARCRDGHPCQARAAWDVDHCAPRNGRCRLHGGLSTGPRTPEGKRRVAEAARQRARRQRAAKDSPGDGNTPHP
jgi:hypothetical protein